MSFRQSDDEKGILAKGDTNSPLTPFLFPCTAQQAAMVHMAECGYISDGGSACLVYMFGHKRFQVKVVVH